jgi:hypothetical protein
MRSNMVIVYFDKPFAQKNQIKCDKHNCKKKFEFLPIFKKSVKILPDFWKIGKSVKNLDLLMQFCRAKFSGFSKLKNRVLRQVLTKFIEFTV